MAAQPTATTPDARAPGDDDRHGGFVFRRAHLDGMPDDGNRYEIADGRVLVGPSPGRLHQHVVREFARGLGRFLEDTDAEVYGQEIDHGFSDTTVLIPDVVVFAPGGAQTEAPDRLGDLLVEVSSPSTRRRDVGLKRDIYARENIAEYWFVDLDRQRLLVHVLGDDGYDLTVHALEEVAASTLLEGFTVRLADLLP